MAGGCPEIKSAQRKRATMPTRAIPDVTFDRIQFSDNWDDGSGVYGGGFTGGSVYGGGGGSAGGVSGGGGGSAGGFNANAYAGPNFAGSSGGFSAAGVSGGGGGSSGGIRRSNVDAEHLNALQTNIERALRRGAVNADTVFRALQGTVQGILDHGGGTGGGGIPVFDAGPTNDPSGTEQIAYQQPLNISGITATALYLHASALLWSDSGTAFFRVYVGGTFGNIDGDLVVAQTATAAAWTPTTFDGVVAKPAGTSTLLTLTIQSSGAGQNGVYQRFNGTIG